MRIQLKKKSFIGLYGCHMEFSAANICLANNEFSSVKKKQQNFVFMVAERGG
jgi:hypothetical protein